MKIEGKMKSDIKVVGKWNVKGMRNVGESVNVKKKKMSTIL